MMVSVDYKPVILASFSMGALFFLILFMLFFPEDFNRAYKQYEDGVDLVSECQKELPRHLECQLVLSAEVKKGDMR